MCKNQRLGIWNIKTCGRSEKWDNEASSSDTWRCEGTNIDSEGESRKGEEGEAGEERKGGKTREKGEESEERRRRSTKETLNIN